jgi:NADPH:quinone reductase-like Zn-dependent oxidoreductase
MENTGALGAEGVFDHYADDFSRRVKASTAGRGVDIVIEHVGEATWERSVRSLARGGRLVTCGATTGAQATLDLRHLFARQLSLIGSYMGTRRELREAATHFFAGRLKPVIDSALPLAQAREAHQRLEASEHFGKIVLKV